MRGARGVHGFGVNEADEGAVGDEAETVEAVLGGGGYELVGGLEGWVVGMGGGTYGEADVHDDGGDDEPVAEGCRGGRGGG